MGKIKRFSFFIFILLSFSQAQADYDLQLETSFRYYPMGGTLKSELGYGHLIWGAPESFLYGYVRLSGKVEGVTKYFASGWEVELFPISILGLKLGRNWIDNHQDYIDYNCRDYVCRGQFAHTFIEIPVFLGYAGWLASYSWRSETWEATNPHQENGKVEYVEPTSGLPLAVASARNVTKSRYVIMYELNEAWRMGLLELNSHADATDVGYKSKKSRMRGVVGQFRAKGFFEAEDEFSILFGAGEFQSPLAHSDPTVFFALRFAPWPKLGF